jgi:hypothetical protein
MYYYLKLDGNEERWISWGRWPTGDPEDEGFYITSNKIRACIIAEKYLEEKAVKCQLDRLGTYSKIPATEQDIKKYRSRVFTH